MMNRFSVIVLVGAAIFSLAAAEPVNQLKNPEIIANEPGRFPHWVKPHGSVKSSGGVIELIPDSKSKKALVFQMFDPAPEKLYFLTCEIWVSPECTRGKVYAEEQRKDKQGKIRYKSFFARQKTVPGQWVKIKIPVKLDPGWKVFYTAAVAEGGSCKIRNLMFARAAEGK